MNSTLNSRLLDPHGKKTQNCSWIINGNPLDTNKHLIAVTGPGETIYILPFLLVENSILLILIDLSQPPYKLIAEHCNIWRNYHDIGDNWDAVVQIINYYGKNEGDFQAVAGPGNFNHPDMVGNKFLQFRNMFFHYIMTIKIDLTMNSIVIIMLSIIAVCN